jgi:hypothetical protein
MLFARRSALAGVWVCTATLTCCAQAMAATMSCHTHTAVAGDTLIALSQRYLARSGDWHSLARINHVRAPRRIPIGTALCIPVDLMRATSVEGTVLEVVGEATRHPPAAGKQLLPTEPVRKGDKVPPGMTLRTGANGYVTVQLADGSVLKIQADTQARLDTSLHYESAGFFASIWTVLRGRVASLVTHLTGGEPRYQIKTPQAVLGVRGTEFRVSTDEARTVDETLSGAVAIHSGPHQALVAAGQGSIALANQHVEAPSPLPAAPDLSGLPALQERLVVKLQLPDVPGALHYRVQVADDADFRRVRGEAVSNTPLIRLADLPDGPYFLLARVANAQGLESPDAVSTFTLKARPEPPIPREPAARAKVRAKAVTLRWTAHPQAQSYRLQVARDTAFHELVTERLDLLDTQALVALPVGDYHWRLATTRVGDDKGPWGDAQLIQMRELPAQPPQPQVNETSLSFQLQAEPGQRFEFQVARDAAFEHMVQEVASAQSQVVIPRPDEGGTLYVRYRAIDADGFIGPYTTAQQVALPACVRSADNTCVQSGSRFMTTQP